MSHIHQNPKRMYGKPTQTQRSETFEYGPGKTATQTISSDSQGDYFQRTTTEDNWLMSSGHIERGLKAHMKSRGMVSDGAGGWVKR